MNFFLHRTVTGTTDDANPNTTPPAGTDRFGLPAVVQNTGQSAKKLLFWLEMLSGATPPVEQAAATWSATVWVRDTMSQADGSPVEQWVQVAATTTLIKGRILVAVDLGGGLAAACEVFVQLTAFTANADSVAKTIIHGSVAG